MSYLRSFFAPLVRRTVAAAILCAAPLFARGLHFIHTADIAPIEALVRPTQVLAGDGTPLLTFHLSGWKTLSEIPEQLVTALILREDADFYDHFGVEPSGLVRGGLSLAGIDGYHGGGSTISMQLAKLLYDGDCYHTAFRKLPGTSNRIPFFSRLEKKASQICVALWLEAHLEKQELLELYLNLARFGHGTRGVDAASRSVFGVGVEDSTTPEQILLLAFVQLPTRSLFPDGGRLGERTYRSWTELANQVGRMLADNDRAAEWSLPANYEFRRNTGQAAPQATMHQAGENWVRAQVLHELKNDPLALSSAMIATHIDLVLQRAAAAALRTLPSGVEGAVAAVDLAGGVRALVGGRGTTGSCRATVMSGRGDHSTGKPHKFAAAFETGLTPNSTILAGPLFGKWPRDGIHSRLPTRQVTLAEAFRQSLNSPVVRLHAFRPQVTQEYRKILTLLDATPPRDGHPVDLLGNGPSGMNLVEQANSYLAFLNRGLMIEQPRLLRSVSAVANSGQPISIKAPPQVSLRRLISPATAEMVAGLLIDTVECPDGTAHALDGILKDERIGAKTGSHPNDQRVVLVLPDRGISISIWIGYDSPKSLPRDGLALDVAKSILGSLSAEPSNPPRTSLTLH